jgi:hypothetical protein
MIRTFLSCLVLAVVAAGSPVHAEPPLAEVTLFKTAAYRQKSATEVVGLDGRPYSFTADAKILKTQLASNMIVVMPNGGKISASTLLDFTEFQELLFPVQFRSLGVLNTSYPFGTYSIRLEFFTRSSAVTLPFQIKSRAFPAAPKLANYAAAQQIDATQPFALKWNRFTEAGPNDLITLEITETCGCTKPVDRSFFTAPIPAGATGITIPANRLEPGTAYDVKLAFLQVDQRVVADNAISRGAGTGSTLVAAIRTAPAP